MTFDNAVRYLTIGKAAKRPEWSGYVMKVAADDDSSSSEETANDGSYNLVFKTRGGTEYVYAYNGTTDAWTAPGTPLPVDAQLLESFLETDWVTGSAETFEGKRTSPGTW